MERWHCMDCETRVPIDDNKCPMCGYERTDYDLAGAAEDTGSYLINRISLPDTKLEINLSAIKLIIAVVIGVGFGGAVILLLRYFLN